MEDGFCWVGVMDLRNGLRAPLYAEGQLVRAADLTLDRSAHDQELWRLRRYLHGWGIVAGLEVNLVYDGKSASKDSEYRVSVSAGYGICPSGEELFLAEEVVLTDLMHHIVACGSAAPGCALDEQESGKSEERVTEAWLVAAPIVTLADPRPAWTADCSHPGNRLAPTRSCGGVRLGLACMEPPHHVRPALDCEEMRNILCKGMWLSLPETHPEPGLLVLGKLTLDGSNLTLHTEMRRRLLPVSVLQDFVIACGCHSEDRKPSRRGRKPSQSGRKPDKFDWMRFAEFAKAHKKALVKAKVIPDKGDHSMTGSEAEALARTGLSVDEVLSTGSPALANKTGLSEARINAIKDNIELVKTRVAGPEF